MNIMQITLLLCFFIFSACSTNSIKRGLSSGGGGNAFVGNGGGACVCRDNGTIISAELLDFTEAKDKLQIEIANIPMSKDAIIESKLKLIEHLNFLHKSLKEELAVVQKIKQFSLDRETLPLTNDFISTVCSEKLGPKCKYEQAAVYYDQRNALKISSQITKNFDNQNLAALDLHEAVYRLDRRFTDAPEVSSEFAKKFIAVIFAEYFNNSDLETLVKRHFNQISNSNGDSFPLLQPVKGSNGKWGFAYLDASGNFTDYKIEPDFDSVKKINSNSNYYVVRRSGNEGLVNIENGLFVRPYYKIMQYIDNELFLVKQERTYNVIDNRGNKRFPRNYEFLGQFNNGYSVFKQNEIYGVVNLDGVEILQTKQKLNGIVAQNNLISFWNQDGKCGYIDINNNTVINPIFKDCKSFSDNGLAPVAIGDVESKFGYINSRGSFVINPKFLDAYEFHNDIAKVKIEGDSDNIFTKYIGSQNAFKKQNDYISYIDSKGDLISKLKFTDGTNFDDGFAKVKFAHLDFEFTFNKNGVIEKNPNENYLIYSFDDFQGVITNRNVTWINKISLSDKGGLGLGHRSFVGSSEGRTKQNCPLVVFASGQNNFGFSSSIYGLIKLNGEYRELDFKYVSKECSDGFTVVKTYSQKYRAINSNGDFITPEYEEMQPLVNGLAPFKINNRWGYLNKDGLIVISPMFEEVSPFTSNTAIVKTTLSGRKARINKKGVILEYLR